MEMLLLSRLASAARRCTLGTLACLILIASPAAAQLGSHLRFTRPPNLVSEDPSIVAMLQDRQGFVWLAYLNGGVSRYDGGRMVHYVNDPANKNSLPAGRVNTLFEDSKGRIWAGTASGLALFAAETNTFTRYVSSTNPGRHQVIRKIISDGAQGLWLATWGGLQHFAPDTGAFTLYLPREGVADDIGSKSVNALALDAKGGLWISTWPLGLDYLAPGTKKFTHFRVDSVEQPDTPINTVEALEIDRQNRLWMGTRRGVYRWTSGTDWRERQHISSPDGRINNFYPARDGGMWAVTMTDGVLRWSADKDAPEHYIYRPNDPYTLPTRSFQSVMQDKSGMVWIGSYNAGVLIANPEIKGMSRIIPPELPEPRRAPNNTTSAISAAPDGRIWLGGLTGITLLDPVTGKADAYHRAQADQTGALRSDTIHSIYQQPGGPLWIGTFAGLNRLDTPGGKFTAINFPSTDSIIASIHAGRGGKLWLGTNTSVIHYDPATGTQRIYKNEQGGPASRRVLQGNAVLEDRRGRVWVGSEYSDGLNLLDPRTGAISTFLHDDADPHSMLSSLVSVLHEDRSGRLWAGTAKGVVEIITAQDGKISFRNVPVAGNEKVFGLQSDQQGKLWFTTPSALIRLDPASGAARRCTAADGLIDGYRVGASFAAADGTLYFGGATGVIAVRPDQVQVEASAPLVAITDITVSNRSLALLPRSGGVELEGPVNAPRSLVLSPDQSSFSIEFAALHFADAGKNSYAYQLEGFDRDWIVADAGHRSASYTNLDPGRYRFKVKAASNRGLWSQVASFSVTVLPRYWETWWFRAATALLAIALLVFAYQVRVRSLTKSKRRLEAKVAARTQELSESNAKLAALSLTDGLTGLTNRRGFDAGLNDAWARAMRSGAPVSLAMFDVDHFKLYNDHYGHQAGDQCLRDVAEVIAAHARRPDDMAARYGGEEFVVLASATSGAATLAIANEIRTRLATQALPHSASQYGVITVSIGIASIVPTADNSPELLIGLADAALYQAKHEGRNRAVLAATEPANLAA
jgi:diguanylate cyclase (GGDEF)-like protein